MCHFRKTTVSISLRYTDLLFCFFVCVFSPLFHEIWCKSLCYFLLPFLFFHVKPSGSFWLLAAPFPSHVFLQTFASWPWGWLSAPLLLQAVVSGLLWLLLVCRTAWWKWENSKRQELAGGAEGRNYLGRCKVEEPDGGSEEWKEGEKEMMVRCTRNF